MSRNGFCLTASSLACWVALSLGSCSSGLDDALPTLGEAASAGDAAAQLAQPSAATSKSAGGPCDSAPLTQRLSDFRYPRAMLPISADSGLWLDVERAAVIDVSDAAAPRVRGKVDLGNATLASDADTGSAARADVTMTALAERRVVAAVRRETSYVMSSADSASRLPDDLVVVGFDEPDAPTVLQRIDIPVDVVLVSVLTPADGSAARLYAISDELDVRCLGPSKQSYLYGFAFEEDELVQTDKVALGDDLALAERRGDSLVLIDGTYVNLVRGGAREPTLRVVSLGQDELVVSERVQAPFGGFMPPSLQIAVQADVMTVVSEDVKVSPGIHVRRYDVSDPNNPRLLSDCMTPAVSDVRYDSSANVVILGERVIVAGSWAAIGDGPVTNGLLELNTACEVQRREQSVGLIAVPGAAAAIEIAISDPHTLRVALRDATHKDAVATATVVIPSERDIALRDNIALADTATFMQGGTLERGLLGVATGWGRSNERVLQLFSFSSSTITPRGTLLDATSLSIPTSSGVAATKYDAGWGETFGTFELDSDANAARPSVGELRLAPLN